ncbi:MAG: phage tail sheath protein, partial [Oscillospiraceae bacterium]|nr:phage tail sheath protein [Oscillospiraceae bacterium]
AVVGASGARASELIEHAAQLNSERVVLSATNVPDEDGRGAILTAAAVAAAIAANDDPSVPINGTALQGLSGLTGRFTDTEIDLLVRGGVTPVEAVGGTVSPVRAVTTRTTTGGESDSTWRELTTILVVDDVIPTIRSALRTRFARSKNTAQSRGAIRSQVILELEDKLANERIDSYGEVKVSAVESDPTICLVEFSFAVAHGLTRIYLTAHITV